MIQMPDGFCGILMLYTFVFNSPYAIFLDALRQRPDVSKSATMNVYEIEKLVVILHLLYGTTYSFFKTDTLRGCDGRRF